MPEQIILAFNPVVAKVSGASHETEAKLSELLSYEVAGAESSHAFQTKSWDGRSSFFSANNKTFPAGFVHVVQAELKRMGHTVRTVSKPAVKPKGPENPIVDEFGNDNPDYDYQMQTLRQVEKHGRGIVQVATGGGKSKIAKLIMARYRAVTLFLTTRGVLLYQMDDQLKEMGFATGILGDGQWTPRRGVNLGMVQTLVQRLEEPDLNDEIRKLVKSKVRKGKESEIDRKALNAEAQRKFDEKTRLRNQTIKLLEMIEVVIGEEAHEAGGESYYKILKFCKNATVRVALTATPFMRAGAEDNMRLMAAFGPKLIVITEKMLIDRGILAQPYFQFARHEAAPKLRKSSPYQRARTLDIVEGQGRNAVILRNCKLASIYGVPAIVLLGIKEHGERLKKLLEKNGIKAEFIYGEKSQAERKAALKRLSVGEIDTLIGTNILDVGVDVPAVALVVLAGGGKAEVQLRQRIGRGLRKKKSPLPNIAFVLDFQDFGNASLRDHARQRRGIIEATPGFAEGILPEGREFPWERFARKSAA